PFSHSTVVLGILGLLFCFSLYTSDMKQSTAASHKHALYASDQTNLYQSHTLNGLVIPLQNNPTSHSELSGGFDNDSSDALQDQELLGATEESDEVEATEEPT